MKSGEEEVKTLGVNSAKVASLVGAAQIASVLTGGIMLIMLARLLQPELYGIYTLASSVTAFFSAFCFMGVGHYLNKYIPLWSARKRKSELQKDLGASIFILVGSGILVALIGSLFSGFLSTYVFHSPGYVIVIELALVNMIFMLVMFLEYNALIGFKDGIGSAATFAGGNLGIMAGSIALVMMGYGVLGAIGGTILGELFGIIIGTYFIMKHSRITFDPGSIWTRAKRIITFSLPLTGVGVLGLVVNNFSVLLLGFFSSPVIIGSFGIAYEIGGIVGAASTFVGSVLVQMFSSALEIKKSKGVVGRVYNYSIYYGALLAVPITVYLIVFAHPFVNSLFPGYRSSLLYTPSICLCFAIAIIGGYASSLAISAGKVRTVFKYTLITSILEMALLLTLVPSLNAYGVIIGMYFAGSVISGYLYMRYVRREMGIRTELGKIYRIILASALLGLVLFPVTLVNVSDTLRLFMGIAVMVIVYPITLALTRAVGRKELGFFSDIGENVPRFGFLFDALVSYISFFIR